MTNYRKNVQQTNREPNPTENDSVNSSEQNDTTESDNKVDKDTIARNIAIAEQEQKRQAQAQAQAKEQEEKEKLRLATIGEKVLTQSQIAMYTRTGYKLIVPDEVQQEIESNRERYHYEWRKCTGLTSSKDENLGFIPVLYRGKEIRVSAGSTTVDGTLGVCELILKRTRIENYDNIQKSYRERMEGQVKQIWEDYKDPNSDSLPKELLDTFKNLPQNEVEAVIKVLIKQAKEAGMC